MRSGALTIFGLLTETPFRGILMRRFLARISLSHKKRVKKMQVHATALKARNRGSHDVHVRPRPDLQIVNADWYLQSTSPETYAWVTRNLIGGDSPGQESIKDKDGKKRKVWKVDAAFMDMLCAVRQNVPAMTFRSYRLNAEGKLVRTTYRKPAPKDRH